ncbi:MAG: synthetase [bacterium]
MASAGSATATGNGVRARLRALLRAHAGPCAVTMGTFDGVHAGHRALVLEVVDVPTQARPGPRRKIRSSSIRRAIAAGVPPGLALSLTPDVRGDFEPLDDLRPL